MADFNLPNEIWSTIFSYLPLVPKKNVTATCKLWLRLIREDQKLSGYILISWYNMEKALEKLQWNWNNWPALKTLELKFHYLLFVEDAKEAVQNAIEKLSLKNCPASLEQVLFDVDLTPNQTYMYGQLLLKYQCNTDQIFGLGQKLDSLQKWEDYESTIKALKRVESMKNPRIQQHILAELEATNNVLLFIASQNFQSFRHLCDKMRVYETLGLVMDQSVLEDMEFGEFLAECDYSMRIKDYLRSPLDNSYILIRPNLNQGPII